MRKISNGVFQCLLCFKKFGSKKKFAQHLRAKHSHPDGLKCCYCTAKTNNKQGLLDHMTSNHKNKIEKCKKVMPLPKKKCEICQEVRKFTGPGGFENHVKFCKLYFDYFKKSDDGFQCLLCLKKVKKYTENNRKRIFLHLETKHSNIEGLKCQFCKEDHGNKQELLTHMITYHANEKGEYINSQKKCLAQHSDNQSLPKHLVTSNHEKPQESDKVINEIRKENQSLSINIQTNQGEEIPVKKCDICQEAITKGQLISE